MIIWRGLGIWVLFIVLGTYVATAMAFSAWLEPVFLEAYRWMPGVAFFLAALACWRLGQYTRTRQSVVPDGELAPDFGHHSLFFIPVHFWAYVLAAIGFYLCVSGTVG